jgi:hypothetical protein
MCDDGAWRRALLGGAAYRDPPWSGSGGGGPVLFAHGGWRGAWPMLAGWCRGPLGVEGLEAVRLVRWFLRHRLGGGVALLATSVI